jgi:hypothetical protein
MCNLDLFHKFYAAAAAAAAAFFFFFFFFFLSAFGSNPKAMTLSFSKLTMRLLRS